MGKDSYPKEYALVLKLLNNDKTFDKSGAPVFSCEKEGVAFTQYGKDKKEKKYSKENKANSNVEYHCFN